MISIKPYFDWGLFKELSHAECRVLTVLCYRANNKSRNAWPSQSLIAYDAGITERSVQTAISKLERRGILEVKKHGALGERSETKATGKGGGRFVYYMKDLDNE